MSYEPKIAVADGVRTYDIKAEERVRIPLTHTDNVAKMRVVTDVIDGSDYNGGTEVSADGETYLFWDGYGDRCTLPIDDALEVRVTYASDGLDSSRAKRTLWVTALGEDGAGGNTLRIILNVSQDD